MGSYFEVLEATPLHEAARTTAAEIGRRAGVSETTARRHLLDAVDAGDVIAARRPGYAERFDYYRQPTAEEAEAPSGVEVLDTAHTAATRYLRQVAELPGPKKPEEAAPTAAMILVEVEPLIREDERMAIAREIEAAPHEPVLRRLGPNDRKALEDELAAVIQRRDAHSQKDRLTPRMEAAQVIKTVECFLARAARSSHGKEGQNAPSN